MTGDFVSEGQAIAEAVASRILAVKNTWWRNPDYGSDASRLITENITRDLLTRVRGRVVAELEKDRLWYTIDAISVRSEATRIIVGVEVAGQVIEVPLA